MSFSGELEDDRETLLAAANLARTSLSKSVLISLFVLSSIIMSFVFPKVGNIFYKLLICADQACPTRFWKRLEPIFAPVSTEDASYLKKQARI